MKILAIIPARGGSKSIANKNIVDVNGLPLLAYTVEPALQAKEQGLLAEVIVSTDDEKIADVSRRLGANVPFLRPRAIAGDRAKSVDFALHAVEHFEEAGQSFDAVMVLQPTSPLRSLDDISRAVSLFEGGQADSLISCYKDELISDLIMYKRQGNQAMPFHLDHNKGFARQQHEDIYFRSGAIYLTRTGYLKERREIVSDCPLLLEMPKAQSINIDSTEDLKMLKGMLCG